VRKQFTKWNSISRIGMAKDKDVGEMIFYRRRCIHRHREFRFRSSETYRKSKIWSIKALGIPVQSAARREKKR